MQSFESFDGVRIAYEVMGPGPAVILHHGFASDSATNWVRPGVADALAEAGRQVVMIDARGHGQSDKPHDPAAYAGGAMVRDLQALIDHLGFDNVDLVGYSMGSLVATVFATTPFATVEGRLRSLVLGGAVRPDEGVEAGAFGEDIAQALEADDPNSIADARGRAFRNFADATGADRLALAALQRGRTSRPSPDELQAISVPTLVLNGERDTLVGRVDSLQQLIPGAQLVIVPGDHLSAVVKAEFRRAMLDFLAEHSPVGAVQG